MKREFFSTIFWIKYLLLPLLLILFIMATYYIVVDESKVLPREYSVENNTALRGSIISKDGYTISSSSKLYKAIIDSRSIDKNKLDLFVNLYSIYTNSNKKAIKKAILSSNGTVVLSNRIDPKTATHLKDLARKLNQKKVFISFKVGERTNVPIGMSIVESGEKRSFITNDSLTPIIGYMNKIEVMGLTKVKGQKGIERYYQDYLEASSNGVLKGPRDLANNIIFQKNSQKSKRVDGYDVILNIPLSLQIKIEKMISKAAKLYDADEIVVAILDSKTARVLSLASSLRYNPNNIKKNEIRLLNSTSSEYAYEPGSVIKPLIFSILLKEGKIDLNEKIKTYNGVYKLRKRVIRDTYKEPYLTPSQIISKSSNIGMIMLSSKLDAALLHRGMLEFGLSEKTGIDLPFEQVGVIPTIDQLDNEVYKATVSYGYGLQTTFIQLLNAYNIFNNDGIMIAPRIVSYLRRDGDYYIIDQPKEKEILTKAQADIVKNILIETVQEGTARAAKNDELEIGGKTGTARIASKGGYISNYNSSFFGFANDDTNKFTIGVFVNNPKQGSYYSSQTALPIFNEMIRILLEENYLKPKKDSSKN